MVWRVIGVRWVVGIPNVDAAVFMVRSWNWGHSWRQVKQARVAVGREM